MAGFIYVAVRIFTQFPPELEASYDTFIIPNDMEELLRDLIVFQAISFFLIGSILLVMGVITIYYLVKMFGNSFKREVTILATIQIVFFVCCLIHGFSIIFLYLKHSCFTASMFTWKITQLVSSIVFDLVPIGCVLILHYKNTKMQD